MLGEYYLKWLDDQMVSNSSIEEQKQEEEDDDDNDIPLTQFQINPSANVS